MLTGSQWSRDWRSHRRSAQLPSANGNVQRKRGRYRYGGGTSSFHPFSAPCSAHLVVVYIIRFKDSVGHCDVPVMILKLFSSFETTVKNIKQKSLTSIVWKFCLCFVGILLIPWILKFLPATFQRPRHWVKTPKRPLRPLAKASQGW